jgi:hypothetical protein
LGARPVQLARQRDLDPKETQKRPETNGGERMKTAIVVLLFLPAIAGAACKKGFVPTDVPGVCQEGFSSQTNPAWVSDEKPPSDKMPSYQREGIKVIDVPSTMHDDAMADQEKRDAEDQGKKAAGIK